MLRWFNVAISLMWRCKVGSPYHRHTGTISNITWNFTRRFRLRFAGNVLHGHVPVHSDVCSDDPRIDIARCHEWCQVLRPARLVQADGGSSKCYFSLQNFLNQSYINLTVWRTNCRNSFWSCDQCWGFSLGGWCDEKFKDWKAKACAHILVQFYKFQPPLKIIKT